MSTMKIFEGGHTRDFKFPTGNMPSSIQKGISQYKTFEEAPSSSARSEVFEVIKHALIILER